MEMVGEKGEKVEKTSERTRGKTGEKTLEIITEKKVDRKEEEILKGSLKVPLYGDLYKINEVSDEY